MCDIHCDVSISKLKVDLQTAKLEIELLLAEQTQLRNTNRSLECVADDLRRQLAQALQIKRVLR